MKALTPMRAIRAKCLDCSENAREVRECPVDRCPLYPYRFGKRPATREAKEDGQRQ
jgi:hypothetical protein